MKPRVLLNARFTAATEDRLAEQFDLHRLWPGTDVGTFLALDNVVLLPHIASSTNETFVEMEELVLANMRQFFSNGSLLTPL